MQQSPGSGSHACSHIKLRMQLRPVRLRSCLRNLSLRLRPVSLVYAGVRLLPLKLRAFLDFAAPRLKARLLQGTA